MADSLINNVREFATKDLIKNKITSINKAYEVKVVEGPPLVFCADRPEWVFRGMEFPDIDDFHYSYSKERKSFIITFASGMSEKGVPQWFQAVIHAPESRFAGFDEKAWKKMLFGSTG